jgi:hypothetical protein
MKHLKEANMSYFQHAARATIFAGILMSMSFACFIHAIFPSLFTHTFSDWIAKTNQQLEGEK